MTIDNSLRDTGVNQTGVVLVIFRDPDVPVNSSVVIERTIESASVPDELLWEEIGVLDNCDIAGTHFIDELPLTLDKFFYRAKHVANGFVDSDYIFEVSGSSAVIPDIDYAAKPWLLDRSPLQLVMVVSSSTNTQFFVTASVNQPVIGATGVVPTISTFASSNTGTITKVNNDLFIIDRPAGAAANNPSFVTFTSTAPGFIAGFDKVDLQPVPTITVDSFLQLIARVSASDENTLGIECSAVNSLGVPINFSVSESFNVGAITKDAANRFTISRPASNIGSVTFLVTSSTPNIVSDLDTVFVQADQQLDPNQFLNLNLTITSSTLESVGVSASVDTAEPYGFGIVSSNNVGTITNDAFGRFTIARPSEGEGSVTFIVTSSDATIVSDVDTIYVSKDPSPYLTVRSEVTQTSAVSLTASVDVFDSNNQTTNLSAITLTAVSQSLLGFTASLASGPTQTAGKDSYVYHINRPAYNEGTGRLTLVATKTGYTSDSDSLEVPERVENLAKLRTIITPVATEDTSVTVRVSVIDALPLVGSYINLSAASIGIPQITPSGPFILSASEAKQFVVSRPQFGSGTGRVNFTSTASLRVNDTDSVDVPERSITTVTPESATITIGAVTSGSDNVTINYSFSSISTAETVFVFAQESSIDPSISSVEFTGTRVSASPLFRNDGRSQFVVPIAQPSNYLLVTFVPIDFLSRRGTVFTRKFQATATAPTAPDAFVSQSNQTITSSSVTNRVMMPASNLPSSIRTFLNGAVYESDVAVTVGASATQSISHTGLTPDTLFSWQYFGVSSDGAVGPGTDFILTTTDVGGTLVTPEFTVDAQDEGNNSWKIYFSITNQGDYPSGTTFEGEILDNAFVFLGNATEQSQFEYYWPTTDETAGYARFRAVNSGFDSSPYTSDQFWSTNLLQPF